MNKIIKWNGNQDGAVIIIMAAAMTVFLGLAALAIDVGFLGASRNELQNAADAAALAGASQLARQNPGNYNVDAVPIKQAAIKAAGLNKSGNASIILDANDVTLGRWNWDAVSGEPFNAGSQPYNAVKTVISNHNVTLFFSGDRGLVASAVAIVGPISGMGGLIPIGIDLVTMEDMIEKGVGNIYDFGQSPGNWGTVDFEDDPGGGTPQIGEWLENGYDEIINIDDEIFSETGVGKIQGGNRSKVQALIGEISFIPVIDGFGEGMSTSIVKGFVAIKITGLSGQGANTTISAEYLGDTVIGGNVDLGTQNFGPIGIKLVK